MLLVALLVVSTSSVAWSRGDDSFDVLIFAQSWPLTECIEWKERRGSNQCNIRNEWEDWGSFRPLTSAFSLPFPAAKTWTIHGIWPTKLGEFGPNFCDRKIKYDSRKVQEIRGELVTDRYFYLPSILVL